MLIAIWSAPGLTGGPFALQSRLTQEICVIFLIVARGSVAMHDGPEAVMAAVSWDRIAGSALLWPGEGITSWKWREGFIKKLFLTP
jgi:hypothetical protein